MEMSDWSSDVCSSDLEYYAAIRQSKKLSSLHPILEFLAECFATAIEEVVKEAKAQYENSKRLDPETRRKRILRFAEKNSPFKASTLAEYLPDVPRRTLDRDLQELTDARKLKAIGDKRGRTYSLR